MRLMMWLRVDSFFFIFYSLMSYIQQGYDAVISSIILRLYMYVYMIYIINVCTECRVGTCVTTTALQTAVFTTPHKYFNNLGTVCPVSSVCTTYHTLLNWYERHICSEAFGVVSLLAAQRAMAARKY